MATSEDHDSVGGKMPVMCDPCGRRKKTTPAAVVCSTCDVHLCGECRNLHAIYAPGDHTFEAIDDVAVDNVLVDMQGLDRCTVHDKMLRYICKDHESLCCDDCHFNHHRTCKEFYKLTDVATDAGSSLLGSVEEVQIVVSKAKDVVDNCKMNVEGSEERKQEIISEIDRKKEEIIKYFDDARKRILVDLDEHFTSDKARLDEVKHGAESVQMNLQNLMSLNEAVRKNGTDVEKFILDFNCKQKAAVGTAKLTEMLSNNYTVKHTLEWNDHLLTIMKEQLVSLGHTQLPSTMDTRVENKHTVDIAVTPTKPIKETVQDPQPRVTDPPSAQATPGPARLTLVKTVKLVRTEGDEIEPWVTGLAFLADGRIAAVDYLNNTCFILNADLQRLGSAFKFQSKPWDMTCYGDSKLAVTLGKLIALLSVTEDSVITLHKTLKTSFYCGSISILDTDTFVVSTTDNQPVRTIDVHGNEREIQHKLLPDKTDSFTWSSACAYIPSTKTLVFSDQLQHTVYMCDLTSGDGRVIVNDQIHSPTGVCAGPAGTVFVCSRDTDSVVQLSPQGDVLASNRVDKGLPLAVHVAEDGTRLVVLSNNFETIKLYSIV